MSLVRGGGVSAYPKVTHRRTRHPKVSPKVTKQVIARDDGLCQIKGENCTTLATCADHRANRGAGGSEILNGPECLIASCQLDNGAKEDADGPYRDSLILRGIRVVKRATNEATARLCALIPVEYADGWYALHMDGTREPISDVNAAELLAAAGVTPQVKVMP
jgi:hypothetical protein